MRVTLLTGAVLFVGVLGVTACSGSGGGSTGPKSTLKVTGSVQGFGTVAGDFNFTVGDTILVGFGATSDRHILYVGVQYGSSPAIRDSIGVPPADSLDVQAAASLVVTRGVNLQVPISAFARDVSGNYVQVTPINGDHVWLYPTVPLHIDSVYDASAEGLYNAKLDRAHGLLYVVDGVPALRVYDVATHTQLPNLVLPNPARAIGLTPSGDTLLATIDNSDSLAIVDLHGGTPVVSSVEVVDPALGALMLYGIQSLGGDSAILAVTCSSCPPTGQALLLVHLTTGSVFDIGYSTAAPAGVFLAASADGSKLFVERSEGETQEGVQTYDVTHHTFGAEVTVPFVGPGLDLNPSLSANAAGTMLLSGEALFTAPFTSDTGFDAPRGSRFTTLSQAGDRVFVSAAFGIMELRTQDLSAVALYSIPARVYDQLEPFVSADGTQLVLTSHQSILFIGIPAGAAVPDLTRAGSIEEVVARPSMRVLDEATDKH